jgi:hypothetical protein
MFHFSFLISFFDPSKSPYLIRPSGTFSKEKDMGNFSFLGRLKIRDQINSRALSPSLEGLGRSKYGGFKV